MDTQSFLRHVLPSSGMYCCFTMVDKYPRQRFFTDQSQLAAYLQEMSGKGYNTYYAVSSFGGNERDFAYRSDDGRSGVSMPTPRSAGSSLPIITSQGRRFGR